MSRVPQRPTAQTQLDLFVPRPPRASVEQSASDSASDGQEAPGHVDPPARCSTAKRKGDRR